MAVFSVTNLMDSGMGSLRQAIGLANNQSGADIINFSSDLSGGTIGLDSGSLGISDSLTINGLGADRLIVDANNNNRVFNVSDSRFETIDVLIDGLTITGGNASRGGGIANRENLTVANSIISGNTGDGIFNSGDDITLTVANSIISGNQGTGINSDGDNYVEVNVRDSIVSNNDARGISISNYFNGGNAVIANTTISGNQDRGIAISTGDYGDLAATITSSTISGNQNGGSAISASGYGRLYTTITSSTITGNRAQVGGGILNESASVTVEDSEIAENEAERGGGIFSEGTVVPTFSFPYVSEEGKITVENSTISGNIANDAGGGIYNVDGFLELKNSTVSGNTANNGGSGVVALSSPRTIYYPDGEYDYVLYPGGTEISNTIIAANANDTDVEGSVGGRFSLIGNGDGTNFVDGENGNIVGTSANPIDPRLGPLQDNGGPTPTQALLFGSPALNAGDPNFTPPPATDQRGFERVVGDFVDIGAFEAQPSEAVPGPEATFGWILGLAILGAARHYRRRRS